jgi:uncharacterized protein (TIGR02246 family)
MCRFVTGRSNCLAFCRLFLVVPAAIAFAAGAAAADKKTGDGPSRSKSVAVVTHAAPDKKTDKKNGSEGNEKVIRATAEAFIKAFNAGDAKGLASLWTVNGSLADDEGTFLKGRQAIETRYAAYFKEHRGARMEVAVKSVEFPTLSTAIEDGVSQVLTRENDPPSAGRYTAVHVQEDGKWLMASVREASMPVASNFAQLAELGWAVGSWEAKTEGAHARFRLHWIVNKSFLQRDFSVHRDGLLASSGTQIIGWDPRSHQITSWTFDSTGGHGIGTWTATPEGWLINSAGVTADGVPTSSKDVVIHVPGDDNVFGWRSFDRRLGETKVPDLREVAFDRVPGRRAGGRMPAQAPRSTTQNN